MFNIVTRRENKLLNRNNLHLTSLFFHYIILVIFIS